MKNVCWVIVCIYKCFNKKLYCHHNSQLSFCSKDINNGNQSAGLTSVRFEMVHKNRYSPCTTF